MIEGGCFCGVLRYRVDGHLAPARACHCSRCRKAFSGASSAYAPLAEGGQLAWVQGEDRLGTYMGAQAWGLAFCRVCGSTLCGMLDGKVHGLTLGCVDGDPRVKIDMHLFVGSKAPWDDIGGDAPQYEAAPPASSRPKA